MTAYAAHKRARGACIAFAREGNSVSARGRSPAQKLQAMNQHAALKKNGISADGGLWEITDDLAA